MPYKRRNIRRKGPKVTLKQNLQGKCRKAAISHQVLQNAWDKKKTLSQNYEALGFVTSLKDIGKTTPAKPSDIKLVSLSNEKREKVSMSLFDQRYIKKLIEKYGDDYEGMLRDKKLNTNQLSVSQLRQQVKKYHRLLNKLGAEEDEEANEGKMEEDANLLE
ncbi:hypothetical protein JH06_3946 [Blastocystis sp. subtype 4]|uniref:hypothetical protein n=1 Tax=Blastocystis sp. subtype 4 TaxID=944170 RepID=UPI00071144FC|nr:hypothetical protein JH06_3946 [Blastocystis sp. subtype 4]KNB42539.1 hypothetical protein JH06_3946 [Blastocystis sp. subtype 4]|eukprot:XP_014525982.1 hypothetical protein JH06_3946 [Blastocystis sp. subtype 4]